MGKRKIISIILGFIFLVVVVLLVEIFEPTLTNFTILVVGLIVLAASCYLFFESRKVFLFTVLGIIFTFGMYSTVYIFWDSFPQISMIALPVFLVLSILCFGIAAFKMTKQLLKK